ncbi:MAG: hypothetical protein QG567_1494 [Campylobacterota bacterium]|nr:hypothetical protein [Campylobacterota bacterium]MDQ1340337.1 hypothetical protein [Campylobacterota bacterium]
MIDKEAKRTMEELTIAIAMIEKSTIVFYEVNKKLEFLPLAREELLLFRKQLQNLKSETIAELKKQINTKELEKISMHALRTFDLAADRIFNTLDQATEEFKKEKKSAVIKNFTIGLLAGGVMTFGYMLHFFEMEKNLTDFEVSYFENMSQKMIGIPINSYCKQDAGFAYFKIDKNINQKGSK